MKPKTNITTQLGMEGMHSAMFPMPVAPGDIDLELKFSQLQVLIGTDPLSPQMWNQNQK